MAASISFIRGTCRLLCEARSHCDRLIVGLYSDASAKRFKGAIRPVQPEAARSIVLAGLAFVDTVVLFADDRPIELIARIRPDILVKGADYRINQVVGHEVVTSYMEGSFWSTCCRIPRRRASSID